MTPITRLPDSVSSAIRVLCEIGTNRRKWAVLGDMLELATGLRMPTGK